MGDVRRVHDNSRPYLPCGVEEAAQYQAGSKFYQSRQNERNRVCSPQDNIPVGTVNQDGSFSFEPRQTTGKNQTRPTPAPSTTDGANGPAEAKDKAPG